jgi:transposase
MSVDKKDAGAADGNGLCRRRRHWSEAEKRRIVAESYEPGESVSRVARRHDVNANQLFTWRRQLGQQALGAPASGFVPMVLAEDPACGSTVMGEKPSASAAEDAKAGLPPPTGRIEILLDGGRRMIVDRAVDTEVLARIVAVLEGQ